MHLQHAQENATKMQLQKFIDRSDGEARQIFIAKRHHKSRGWLYGEAYTNTIPIPKITKTTVQYKMNTHDTQTVSMSLNEEKKKSQERLKKYEI